ncbi:hypothetical protein Gohar_013060 [Gossypium harknessii]|nr:hypothetical protein [Gossypium harknessii]
MNETGCSEAMACQHINDLIEDLLEEVEQMLC